MFKPYYECHITIEPGELDKDVVEGFILANGCKFSYITNDPALGRKPFYYATIHYHAERQIMDVVDLIESIATALRASGNNVIRTKIELVLYDNRTEL